MMVRRFVVSGRVQGVFFRASTREQAVALGLSGHAINRADGRVEVLAAGSPAAVEALHAWLAKGPPLARVDQLSVHEVSEQPAAGFRVA